jgi:hypothetical protein
LRAGVIYGGGDTNVHAGEHPTAFVVTALWVVTVIAILVISALGSGVGDLAVGQQLRAAKSNAVSLRV